LGALDKPLGGHSPSQEAARIYLNTPTGMTVDKVVGEFLNKFKNLQKLHAKLGNRTPPPRDIGKRELVTIGNVTSNLFLPLKYLYQVEL
jgi:hypothetical protein